MSNIKNEPCKANKRRFLGWSWLGKHEFRYGGKNTMTTGAYEVGLWIEDWRKSERQRRECVHCGLLQERDWDIGWDHVRRRPSFENMRWVTIEPKVPTLRAAG